MSGISILSLSLSLFFFLKAQIAEKKLSIKKERGYSIPFTLTTYELIYFFYMDDF